MTIVEIKVSKADLLGDGKWPEYLDYCDRYFWAVPQGFDLSLMERPALMPERTGLIVADRYDAAILREAQTLAQQGCVEITLLGQTVNSYRYETDGQTTDLADLLLRETDGAVLSGLLEAMGDLGVDPRGKGSGSVSILLDRSRAVSEVDLHCYRSYRQYQRYDCG